MSTWNGRIGHFGPESARPEQVRRTQLKLTRGARELAELAATFKKGDIVDNRLDEKEKNGIVGGTKERNVMVSFNGAKERPYSPNALIKKN